MIFITAICLKINGRPWPLIGFIAYLNNHVFPPLLTKEQEAAYIERSINGDLEGRNALIEHNLRLVAHICKKFETAGIDREDLISIGTIGLIKAINTFSPDRKARLATYAARCIENEILMFLRAGKNAKSEISLQDPVGADKEGNEVTLLEILAALDEGVPEMIENIEEKKLLRKALHVLNKREQYVIEKRYGLSGKDALTQKEVGKAMGISRSYVSRIEKKALEKLKAELERRDS